MILYIFILVYLMSVSLWLILCYYDNEETIYTIGNLLDKTEGFMWCPFINTGAIIVIYLGMGIIKLFKLSKLNILWKKFRNIKIR